MPPVKVHCAISKKRTGNDFAELHRWIDEPTIELGSDHRIKRHYYNEKDKNTIKRFWDGEKQGLGEKAVIEWLFHIAIDNLYTAFKMSSKSFSYGEKAYNLMTFGLRKSGYIHCTFETADEEEFYSDFQDDYQEDY